MTGDLQIALLLSLMLGCENSSRQTPSELSVTPDATPLDVTVVDPDLSVRSDLGVTPDATPLDMSPLDMSPSDQGSPAEDSGLDMAVDMSLDRGVFASQRQQIRFKGAHRLKAEIANTLAIAPNEVCNELERFDCISLVHPISLGGVEPYVSNLYEATEDTTISAPMIVERIGLQACYRRYEMDSVAGAEPHLFVSLPTEETGLRLMDVDAPEVEAVITHYFQTILRRSPTAEELNDFKTLYTRIETHPDTSHPVAEWSQMSCFALLTSIEFLFY